MTMRDVAVVTCVLLLVAAAPARAATTSRLTGNVVDNQNVALPGVTVTLTSAVLIGGPQVQITDAEGKFQFNLLPPGQYRVMTELSSFIPVEVDARVALDRETQVQIQMVLGAFEAQIEVSAEAPVVDATQVNSGESYNEEFLRNAAVGMGGRNYLAVIGDAAGSVGTGNVRVMGSVTSDNVYLVDGLNTTDPVTATFGTNFNYDAIQEVSIQTTGFEAEFGQALGGVVNLVTKSGGNEFSGSLDVRFRDQSFAESGDHYDPDLNPGSLRTISATLGGPIMRDTLWFFLSVGNSLSKSTPQSSPVTREFKGTDWIVKGTWQASDANRVTAKMSADPAEIPYVNASRYMTPEAGAQQDQGGEIYQAELNSVLSDSWLLTLQAGFNRQNLDAYPMSGRNDLPGYTDLDLEAPNGVDFGNYNNAQYSKRNRDQYRGTVSYFLDNALGSHELKGGMEYSKVSYTGRNFYTGGAYFEVYEYRDVHPGGSGWTDLDGDGYTDWRAWIQLPGADEESGARGDLWTYFLQDSWRPLPNLTIKPGVRLDTALYPNDFDQTVADFESWQPRLGVAWDFLGTGKSVVRANWGTFMHPGSSNLANWINGRPQGSIQYLGYETHCREYLDPNHRTICSREWLAEHRALDGQELVTVDAAGHEHYWYQSVMTDYAPLESLDTLGVGHLEPPYSESLSIAFEQQLWAETSVSLEYVNKDTKNLLEDTCVNNPWVWDSSLPAPSLDDPSTWTSETGCTNWVMSNPDGLRRNYDAWIVQFETRYKGLHLLGNYTYGTSQGNSEAEADVGYFTTWYDNYPLDFYNTYGYLSDDRRQRVKLNGYLLLPLDFTVGFDAYWSSSPALNVMASCANSTAENLAAGGYDPRIVAICANGGSDVASYFLLPRGARRGTSNYQLDLSVAKAFKVKSLSLELSAAIINLLGSERVTTRQTAELLPNQDPTLPTYNPNNVYGAALAWQQPRRYEIGFRVDF